MTAHRHNCSVNNYRGLAWCGIRQSAEPLIQPSGEQPTEERNAHQAAVPLHAQSHEDHWLAERVECALRATGYGVLRTVRVSVNARIVILAGRVSSHYVKQVAQATALAVPGAHQIRNFLDVVRPASDRHNACDMPQPQMTLGVPPDRKGG